MPASKRGLTEAIAALLGEERAFARPMQAEPAP